MASNPEYDGYVRGFSETLEKQGFLGLIASTWLARQTKLQEKRATPILADRVLSLARQLSEDSA